MKAEEGSKTAEGVAAFRAIHLKHHDEPKVFEDPYAIHLTSGRLRRLVTNRFLYWIATSKIFYGWTYPLQGQALARARFAEERLEQALSDGMQQYVILAAGFDSFVLRRKDLLDRLAVFEVDHPATQRVKLKRLADAGLKVPPSVTCIPVDMEGESLSQKLLATSYSRDVRTFFSLLGTVPYLTREAFGVTLEAMAECSPPGNLLVFDFADPGFFEAIKTSNTHRRQDRATRRRGEPLITGFNIDELRALLKEVGWDLVGTLSPEDQRARYFAGRRDQLGPLEHFHIAHATRC